MIGTDKGLVSRDMAINDLGSNASGSLAIKLLRVIGSPFASEQELLTNKDEALELYDYAIKNKIALLYLEALKNQGKLEEFQLKSVYGEEWKKHNEQLMTASRVSELFNSSGVSYAIFKSIMPFLATPNDVDILHFGSDSEYKKAVEIMLQSSYIEVKGSADSSQHMFHDARDGELNPHPPEKDIYDVDLYQKVAASYLIYLDKVKLAKNVTEINMAGSRLRLLKPGAELVAIITHSIIPEQLFTLFTYYATLHHLSTMNSEEVTEFVNLAKENNVTFPIKAHCSLVADLHQAAHGFIPEKVQDILDEVGTDVSEVRHLRNSNFKTPHHYSWSTIIRTLLEKAKEDEFRKSLFIQAFHMLNPRLAKWVVSEIIWRHRRETY